jgi:CBS domain-containing protein
MKRCVRDVMSTQVVAVRRGASFKEMAASLRQYRVSAFPVIDDDGKVIGVVSEADLLAKEAAGGEHAGIPGVITGIMLHKAQDKAGGITAGDLMTRPAITVRPEDTTEHAARLMYTLQVKRLPVVDADGMLLGIISRADVLAVFDRPDEEIHAEITDDIILREFLIDPAQFMVTVKEGVVTLQGSPESAELGHQLVSKVRRVQGVVAVRDELAYPPRERSVARGLYI